MSTIRIEPPARLRGTAHRLRGDYIEGASWAVVAAATGGDIEISGVLAADFEPITEVLAEMHLQFELEGGAGKILAYGVAVDNTSGDAIYVPAQREP